MYLWKIKQNIIREMSDYNIGYQEFIERLEYYLDIARKQQNKNMNKIKVNRPHNKKTIKLSQQLRDSAKVNKS